MSELFWIGPALVFGLLAARVGLPPMVGFLIGGFALNVYGLSDADHLKAMGDLGVTLLLFKIGLIVGAVALSNGWLSGDWLVIIALALTMTFITAAPLNAGARNIVAAIQPHISRLESPCPLPEDVPFDPGDARIAIIGMARLGAGAYDALKAKYGDVVIGIDPNPSVVARHQAAGRSVILADVPYDDFWFRVGGGQVEAVLLAMNEYEENLGTACRIHSFEGRRGFTFAVADYPEQADALQAAGVTAVWDFDTEADTGFAEEVISHLGGQLNKAG